jgi:ABC-type Fe3+/spermidine/putrescine transport system ATPase subunit
MTLRVRDLSKRFGNRWALRDVSFEAEKGTIVGVFGAAGSGKSTLLEIVAGTVPINSGVVDLQGNEIPEGSAKLLTEGSGTDSLLGSLLKRSRPSAAVSVADQLSAALASPIKVLLLDEPFVRLDRPAVERLGDQIIESTREKDLVTLVASSDFEHILRVCDEVCVLRDGYVERSGTPREIYQTPASRYVAALTGAVNIIEARRLTSSKSAVHEFQTIEGEHRLFVVNDSVRPPAALNQNLYLAARPEHISISFGASFPEDNLLRAVVTGSRFMGPKTVVYLDAGGIKLEAFVPRLVGLNDGDECMVGLPPDRIAMLAK